MDCFVAYAPLRKRFAFVAGNDGAFLRDPDGNKVEAVCHRAA